MRNVLIDLILRLEDFLLTQSARHKVSDLYIMTDEELQQLCDKHYTHFKNLI